MLIADYPILGDHRFPQMLLEWIFLILCIDLGTFFFIRFIKQDKHLRNLQDFGYGILLIGFGFMVFWFLISDYFAEDESTRLIFLILGYYATMLAAFSFIVCMEKYKKYLFFRYFFSICFLIIIIIFTIGLIIDLESSRILSRLFWPVFIFFFLIYLIDFSRRVQNKEKVIIGLLKFLPGFSFLMIGFAFTTDFFEELLGVNLRFIGVLSELISILFLSYYFYSLPPFSEFEWEHKMEHVFVMNRAGICLFNQILDDHSEYADQNLVAGAISSINILLEELTAEKGIVVINKKGKSIIIFPGTTIYGVMFAREELNYIKVLLKRFVDKFEAVYRNILVEWDGEVSIFKPTGSIVNEIFHLKIE